MFGSPAEERGRGSVRSHVLRRELGLAPTTGFGRWERQGRISPSSAQFILQLLASLQEKRGDTKAAPRPSRRWPPKMGFITLKPSTRGKFISVPARYFIRL